MDHKIKAIDRSDGTRLIIDQRGPTPVILYDGPRHPESPLSVASQPKKQLGDWVESKLSAIGLTKESYLAIKEAVGLPRNCNCDARQKWLNEVGEKFGEAAQAAWAKLWG